MTEIGERVLDALEAEGVSVEDVGDMTDEELLDIPGIGPASLEELREAGEPPQRYRSRCNLVMKWDGDRLFVHRGQLIPEDWHQESIEVELAKGHLVVENGDN